MTVSWRLRILAAASLLCAVNAGGGERVVASRPSATGADEPAFTGPRAKALFDGEDSRKPSSEELAGRWAVAARACEGNRGLAELQRTVLSFYHFYSVSEIRVTGSAELTATALGEFQEVESPVEWTETAAAFAERRPIPGGGVHASSYRYACRATARDRLLCKVRSALPSGLEFTGYLDLKRG